MNTFLRLTNWQGNGPASVVATQVSEYPGLGLPSLSEVASVVDRVFFPGPIVLLECLMPLASRSTLFQC